jgi:Flp pilus assembly protein TadG
MRGDDGGQAAVELALSLPVVVVLLLVVVQAGLLVRDQVLVVHAAREAARAAAVEPRPGSPAAAARRAAIAGSGLDPDRLEVRITAEGPRIRANVRYRSRVVVPILSSAVRDIPFIGNAAMISENN